MLTTFSSLLRVSQNTITNGPVTQRAQRDSTVWLWGSCGHQWGVACLLSLYGLYLTVDWFQGRLINHSALGVPLIPMFWNKFWRRDAIKHLSHEPLSSPEYLSSWMLRCNNFKRIKIALPISIPHQRTDITLGSELPETVKWALTL